VHLEMTALVLGTVQGGTFETHHNHLEGGLILATVAHNFDILALHWWLVANYSVSCGMEKGEKSEECNNMGAVNECDHTHAANDINWCVFRIDCQYQWRLMNYYLMNLNCHHGIVASQIGHQVEPYLLSSLEIHSWT